MRTHDIPVHKITVPITGSELILHVRGDFHYGVENLSIPEGLRVLKREQDQHRGNIFTIETGDWIENSLNGSVGHGYDVAVRDPDKQIKGVVDFMTEVNKNLYGRNWNTVNPKLRNEGTLSAGTIGNHEYRTRKEAGLWTQEDMYKETKTLNLGIQGLLELTIVNKKLKLSRTYMIYVNHRPTTGAATTVESIIKACKRKRADIPADVYVYGHVHRRVIQPDVVYDVKGKMKKVLYITNPSPIQYMEYADWNGFSPTGSAWYVNCRLPLDPNAFAWGKV